MKTTVIYIINKKEELILFLCILKAMVKNTKYKIILVNNILNYN